MPAGDDRQTTYSLTSGVNLICPRTHDLSHHHRADGRAGDSVRRSMEDRERFPHRRRPLV